MFKFYIYDLINRYRSNLEDLIEINKLNKKLIKESSGRSIGLLERLGLKSLLKETGIVIEKLKQYNLTHKINPLYKYSKNTLTVGYIITLHDSNKNGKMKRDILTNDLNLHK